GADGSLTFGFLGQPAGSYTIRVTAVEPASALDANSTGLSTSVAVTSDERGGSGGGGCDAGFGILSLLAAGAFVTLRKKG
ncbi:MAG: hypothetical protein LBT31_00920, partial [Synergistaceae bacterium]|nr:hypothetical protein [Synergistaceae bacterium]